MHAQFPGNLVVKPVLLEHEILRMEPLALHHAEGISKVLEPEMFRWFAGETPADSTLEACQEYVRKRLKVPAVSFAMVLPEGTVVGHSSYMTIRPDNMGLEIGSTWIAKACQGTFVNPTAKYLMLRHAFEELGCVRVELKTDERNLHSRAAIAKLGAKEEGTLRRYQIMSDGFVRNTVMFGITRDEWPQVKAGLEARIDALKPGIS